METTGVPMATPLARGGEVGAAGTSRKPTCSTQSATNPINEADMTHSNVRQETVQSLLSRLGCLDHLDYLLLRVVSCGCSLATWASVSAMNNALQFHEAIVPHELLRLNGTEHRETVEVLRESRRRCRLLQVQSRQRCYGTPLCFPVPAVARLPACVEGGVYGQGWTPRFKDSCAGRC